MGVLGGGAVSCGKVPLYGLTYHRCCPLLFEAFWIVPALGRQIQGYLGIGNSNSHFTRPFYYNPPEDPVDPDQ